MAPISACTGRQALSPESETDRIERLLTPREVQSVSATRNQALVVLDLGDGFVEPVPTNTLYAETLEEHLASRAEPWPVAPHHAGEPAGAAVTEPDESDQPLPWLAAHLAAEKSKPHQARLDRIARMLDAVRDEERVER